MSNYKTWAEELAEALQEDAEFVHAYRHESPLRFRDCNHGDCIQRSNLLQSFREWVKGQGEQTKQ
jgi:hypothetical protein